MNFHLKESDMARKARETGSLGLYMEIILMAGLMLAVSALIRLLTEVSVYWIDRSGAENPHELAFQVRMYLSMSQVPLTIAAPMALARWGQKRPLWTMGFRKQGWHKEYLWGAVSGIAAMTAVVLPALALGALQMDAVPPFRWDRTVFLILSLLCFLVQGMSEEVLFRGYFLTSMARRKGNTWIYLLVSALFFAFSHLVNRGMASMPFLNLFLFGIFAGLMLLKRGSIWAIAGFHSLWNFTQGNLWGVSVSGNHFGPSLLILKGNQDLTLLNGGDFGLEGSILCSVILLAGVGILLKMPQKYTVQ